jgi:hypothetical protein
VADCAGVMSAGAQTQNLLGIPNLLGTLDGLGLICHRIF